MPQTQLIIDGMSCGGCVRGVTAALERLYGVTIEEVSIGRARVSFDSSQTSPAAIAEAITDAGYPARVEGDGTAA